MRGCMGQHGKHGAQAEGAAEEHFGSEPFGHLARRNLRNNVAPEEAAQDQRFHLLVPLEGLQYKVAT